jgi:hypothetical protein
MKRCSYCGGENEEFAIHCVECGTQLQGTPSISFRHELGKFVARATKEHKYTIIGLGGVFAALAVCIASIYLHRPRLEIAEVVQIANRAAEMEGFRLHEYESPSAKFEFPDRNHAWTVMYNLKLPGPFGPPIPRPKSAHGAPRHFFVIVDDKTKHTQMGMLEPVREPVRKAH